MNRTLKAILYPLIPSSSPRLHDKRRKGLFYRHAPARVLECQQEQDRIFWSTFLKNRKSGTFLEVGGDGVVGSHTIGLEINQGWEGAFWSRQTNPRPRIGSVRKCQTLVDFETLPKLPRVDLLAVHQSLENPEVWELVRENRLHPRWVVVENREPDPQWCHLLEGLGYRLKFFFHDDEYYQFKGK